jgi:hypothetical protein
MWCSRILSAAIMVDNYQGCSSAQIPSVKQLVYTTVKLLARHTALNYDLHSVSSLLTMHDNTMGTYSKVAAFTNLWQSKKAENIRLLSMRYQAFSNDTRLILTICCYLVSTNKKILSLIQSHKTNFLHSLLSVTTS